jgi:hypothetical protein
METTGAVSKFLAQMDAQCETIFAELGAVDGPELWRRPAAGEWCIGENLTHATAVLQSFRRLLQAAYAVLAPIGYLGRRRPYQVEIDDVYARPGFPLNSGWLWSPRFTPEHPATLAALYELAAAEHGRVRRFYTARDAYVLGNTPLYDPAIGWLNLVQALRVGVYHDAHHFATIRRLLAGSDHLEFENPEGKEGV